MRKLTLIIPAKSESETLPIVLKELKKKKFNFIIVMDKSDIETINSIKKFRKNYEMRAVEIFQVFLYCPRVSAVPFYGAEIFDKT